MKKEMLINVLQSEECRIAIVEDGVLEELYVERSSQESYVGNIYKGRIVNIEPSIQAAFVDFGIGRNGFLHVSDVDPAYYKHLMSKEDLAQYEADLDREYGPSNATAANRGRDRGNRVPRDRGPRPAQPMTSWLEPQTPQAIPAPAIIPPAIVPPAKTGSPITEAEEVEGFATGLDEVVPLAEGIVEFLQDDTEESGEPPFSAEVHSPFTKPVESDPDFSAGLDQDFSAGLNEGAPTPVHASLAPSAPTHSVRPSRAEKPQRKPVLTEPFEDDEFAAGIVDETHAVTPSPESESESREETHPAPSTSLASEEAPVPLAALENESNEPVEANEPLETNETVESEPKARKGRPRKPKSKVEESAVEAEETTEQPAEGKGKAKPRRSRKKTEDGESPEGGDLPDDKPRYMGGAERRTSADEPEITPFFEDSGGFDPDAPNDRFAKEQSRDAEKNDEMPFADEVGPEETGGEEIPFDAPEDELAEAPASQDVESEPIGVGRGFNDDFESGPPRRDRNDRNDRNDRGRGRYRSDRNDRNDRGSRDRNDRGPRAGSGFKAGPKGGRDRGVPKPKIEDIFRRGQEVLVQVIKEAVGTKGPTLSTYISIAGRYLVLMPSLNRVGVSRKIEDHEARRRLRDIMNTLSPPKGVGFIVRTAAVDRDAKELRNDLAYLLRLWQVVVKRIKRVAGPVEIYRESDMITRTIRDIFTNDIDTIWVDEANAFAHASEFLQIVMPKFASRIRYFESSEPLFHKYGVEDEIAKIHQKRIEMPLGGSLVIEQTEALVAIDVNSGNFRAENNAEETAFQMNLHAAKEIARQLRLRDLGGVIVNDFIDMRSETHRRKVEDALREALRRDRARTKILRVSQFGLIEMTRQRIRPSLKRSIFSDCPHCRGSGFVKTSESLSIDAMRLLQLAAHRSPGIASVQVGVHIDVAHYLLNKRRKDLAGLEERGKMEIQVTGQTGVSPDTLTIRCFDHNGNEVRLLPPAPVPRQAIGRFPARPERSDRRYPQPLD